MPYLTEILAAVVNQSGSVASAMQVLIGAFAVHDVVIFPLIECVTCICTVVGSTLVLYLTSLTCNATLITGSS